MTSQFNRVIQEFHIKRLEKEVHAMRVKQERMEHLQEMADIADMEMRKRRRRRKTSG